MSPVRTIGALAAVLICGPMPALAQAPANDPTEIEDLEVIGEAVQDPLLPGGMQSVTEGRIYAGKKASVVSLDEQPRLVEPNLRQVFSRLPGLFVSEQRIPTHYNVNYRGLGDPHESEFVAFFMDTVPLASDLFGYPTIYFLPPAQRIERVELTRGGSGLLYGPQVGPSVNFVMRRADASADNQILTEQSFGSNNLYSTYNEARWANGDWGLMATLDRRQSDGERANEDFDVTGGYLGVEYAGFSNLRIGFDLDLYQSDSGEAGRLTSAEFRQNPRATKTPFNRVQIDRVMAALRLDQQLDGGATLNSRLFFNDLDRVSRRSSAFVAPANPPTSTNIDDQDYTTYGFDGRYARPWGADHALTLGATFYQSVNPRARFVSADIDSDQQRPQDLVFDQDRDIRYGALFAETLFRFGAVSLVPSLRYERINYDLSEPLKLASLQRDPIDVDTTRSELLLGLGSMAQLSPTTEIYANVSESYRPQRFDDLANPTAELAAENGPRVSNAMNYEVGLRSMPLPGLQLDISLYRIDFDDKIEQIQVNQADILRVNTGDSRHQGLEFAMEYRVLGDVNGDKGLTVFLNGSLLDAEITRSANPALVGNTPAFAPDYLIRSGLLYDRSGLNLALTATFVAQQFWQDSNLARGTGAAQIDADIPAYRVLDLSTEYTVTPRWTVLAGINNLLDERYFSRVRSDGIDPAAERSIYAGLRFAL